MSWQFHDHFQRLYGFWIVPALAEGPGLDEVVEGVVSDLEAHRGAWGSGSLRPPLTAPGLEKAAEAHGACPGFGRHKGPRDAGGSRGLSQGRWGLRPAGLWDAGWATGHRGPHLEVMADTQLQAVGAHGKIALRQVDVGHEEVGVHGGGVQLQATLQGALGAL